MCGLLLGKNTRSNIPNNAASTADIKNTLRQPNCSPTNPLNVLESKIPIVKPIINVPNVAPFCSLDTSDAAKGINCWVILALTPIKNTDISNKGKLGASIAALQATTNKHDKIVIKCLRAIESPKGEINNNANA